MAPTGGAVINRHEIITGDFTRDTAFAIPGADLHLALTARLQERARLFNATRLAETALGDTVYANMILLGAAYQQGLLPLTQEALLEAIALNGAKVPQNQQAFALGRWAMVDPDLDRKFTRAEAPVQDPEASRLAGLRAYGSGRLARYEEMRGKLQSMAPELQELALQSYHKLLSYKDEYEVARLLLTTKTQVAERFEGDYEISYHLAPPLLAQTGPDGRPQKRSFGAWFDWVSQGLARLSFLRETPFDPFGYSAERRMERQLIKDFESLVGRMLRDYDPERLDIWQEILSLPLNIRGFGPVKLANAKAMQKRRAELLDQLTKGHASERSAA
jgi:indolepyruvate ferredoxin oxidoreductase